MKLKRPQDQDRLRSAIIDDLIIGERDDCWTWDRNVYSSGYVFIPTGKRCAEVPAHRAIAEIAHGGTEGNHVHHRCGNKACGNPRHLEVLTPTQHQLRHGADKQCEHGEEFRAVRKSGKSWCRKCQSERYRSWYYDRGGREYFQRRNTSA